MIGRRPRANHMDRRLACTTVMRAPHRLTIVSDHHPIRPDDRLSHPAVADHRGTGEMDIATSG
jgi:hypothetical protein